MKSPKLIVFLLGIGCGVSAVSAITVDPDIALYGLGKTKVFNQTDDSSLSVEGYDFNAFIDVATSGVVNSARVYGPGASLLGVGNDGPQDLNFGGNNADYRSANYANQGLLDAAFPNDTSGNYELKIDTGTTGGPLSGYDYRVSFDLGGDAYPTASPVLSVTNGFWSDGVYIMNSPQSATTFTWNFTDYNVTTDVIVLSIHERNSSNVIVDLELRNADPGSHVVAANLFESNKEYDVEIGFIRVVDNPTDVPGVNGVAFYGLESKFEIQAVPEPSTFVLMALGLGVIVFMSRRRLRA